MLRFTRPDGEVVEVCDDPGVARSGESRRGEDFGYGFAVGDQKPLGHRWEATFTDSDDATGATEAHDDIHLVTRRCRHAVEEAVKGVLVDGEDGRFLEVWLMVEGGILRLGEKDIKRIVKRLRKRAEP